VILDGDDWVIIHKEGSPDNPLYEGHQPGTNEWVEILSQLKIEVDCKFGYFDDDGEFKT
jgi:hypothetical protein